jgi:hypothetical protein
VQTLAELTRRLATNQECMAASAQAPR